jgi:hypothetical protein
LASPPSGTPRPAASSPSPARLAIAFLLLPRFSSNEI